jgi:hypothetical protein
VLFGKLFKKLVFNTGMYPANLPLHTPPYVQRKVYQYLNNKEYCKIDTQSHSTGIIAVKQRNAVIERQILALRR